MWKRIAISLVLALHSPTAFADAKADCFNRKLEAKVVQRACTKLIGKRPKDARLYAARADGTDHVTPENYTTLLADYTKALSLDDKLVVAYLGRARLNFHKSSFKFMPPNFDPATMNADILSDLNRAVELEPEHAKARWERGFHHMTQDRPELALVDYDVLVRLEPKEALSYSGRAWVHFKMGRYAAAVADYNTSFKLAKKPRDRSYAQRGLAHSLNGDDAAAVKDYDQAFKHKSDFYDTKLNRSFSLFNLGQYKQAAKALKERETVGDIQWTLLRLHAMEKAAFHLDPAIQALHDTLDYDHWHKPLVEYYLSRRKLEDVLIGLAKLPLENQCTAWFFIGQQQLYRKEREAAVRSFNNAISICPKTSLELAAAKVALKKL